MFLFIYSRKLFSFADVMYNFLFIFQFNSENFLRLQIFYEDLSVSKTINEEAYKVNLRVHMYLTNRVWGTRWENIGPKWYSPSVVRSVQNRPRANIPLVRYRARFVNYTLARMKLFRGNMLRSWKNITNFQRTILIWSRVTVYSRLMLNNSKGKRRRKIFSVKASSLRNLSHKSTRISSRVIVQDHSRQFPIQNIGPVKAQSDS